MAVSVGPGTAYINGKLRTFDTDTLLNIPTANGSYPRIDNIVVERNDTDREITLKVVQGTYSGTTASAINPTRANGIYQLVIARIAVGAGVTEITPSAITDCRADTGLCGYVSNAIDSPDFEEWYDLNQSQFEEWYNEQQKTFKSWFSNIQAQLSTDAAGNLQNEIDNTNRSETISITASGTWTAETVNGSNLYTYLVNLTNVYIDVPTVSLAASGSNTIPTAAEQTAYALIQYVTVDSDTNKLKLYCTAKPSSDFVIGVKGVKK